MIFRHITVAEGQALTEKAEKIVETRYDSHDKCFHVLIRQEEVEEWRGVHDSIRKR
jgi:hypothetical protein